MVLGKRLLSGAVAALMAMALCIPAYAAEDILPPELVLVRVTPAEAVASGFVTVYVQARDAGSGVRSITVGFRGGEGATLSETLTARDFTGGGVWQKEWKLPAGQPGGRYVLYTATVNDNAGNSRDYRAADDLRERDTALPLPSQAAFTVRADGEQVQKPALQSVTVDAAGVPAGGALPVTVLASGAQRVDLTFQREDNSGDPLYLTLRAEHRVTADTYRGSIEPGAYLAAGRYELASVRVTAPSGTFEEYRSAEELARNVTWSDYLPLPEVPGFELYAGKLTDTLPPVLQDVELEASSVQAGGKVRVTVRAADAGSGLKQLTVRLYNKTADRALSADLLAKDTALGGGAYAVQLAVPAGEPAGEYVLERVSLTDEAGNRAWYGRERDLVDHRGWLALPQELTLAVGNTSAGGASAPLLLDSVSVDTAEQRKAPGSIGVTVRLSDQGAGVERVYLRFYNEENSHSLTLALTQADYDAKTGCWRGNVKIPAQEKTGWFGLATLAITDREGNRQNYCTAERMNYGDAEDDSDYFEEDRMVLPSSVSFYVVGNADQ